MSEWTKKCNVIPSDFRENSILAYAGSEYFNKKGIVEGYRLMKSQKVVKVGFQETGTNVAVAGKVRAAMKTTIYSSSVNITKVGGEVIDAHCTCKGGTRGKCKHVYGMLWAILDYKNAALTMVPEEISATSLPCTWNGNPSKMVKNLQTFSSMNFVKEDPLKEKNTLHYIHRRRELRQKRAVVVPSSETLQKFCTANNEVGKLPFFTKVIEENHYTIPPRTTTNASDKENCPPSTCKEQRNYELVNGVSTRDLYAQKHNIDSFHNAISLPVFPGIENIFCTYQICDELLERLHIKLSLEEARNLEQLTVLQGSNNKWKEERKIRVTSTKFGEICHRRKVVDAKFVERMMNSPNIAHLPAVRKGREMEPLLKTWYVNEMYMLLIED